MSRARSDTSAGLLDKSQILRHSLNVPESLANYAAGQLRAAMGLKQVSALELARRLKKTDDWVGRRRNGQTPIAMDELPLLAAALDMPLGYFLPESERVA